MQNKRGESMTTKGSETPTKRDTVFKADDEPILPTKSTDSSGTQPEVAKVGSRDAPGG
jgi:hypothetical protein